MGRVNYTLTIRLIEKKTKKKENKWSSKALGLLRVIPKITCLRPLGYPDTILAQHLSKLYFLLPLTMFNQNLLLLP